MSCLHLNPLYPFHPFHLFYPFDPFNLFQTVKFKQMDKIKSFEDLSIWQQSFELVKHVYKILESHKDYGFRDQMQRAAISVMNNIAEGFERESNKEYIRFLNVAKASCGEVRSMTYLLPEFGITDLNNMELIQLDCKKISSGIANLTKHLKKFENN